MTRRVETVDFPVTGHLFFLKEKVPASRVDARSRIKSNVETAIGERGLLIEMWREFGRNSSFGLGDWLLPTVWKRLIFRQQSVYFTYYTPGPRFHGDETAGRVLDRYS